MRKTELFLQKQPNSSNAMMQQHSKPITTTNTKDEFHDAKQKTKTNTSTIKTAAKGRTKAEDMTSKRKRRNTSEANTTDLHKRSELTHFTKPS
jgi:hypothetical protein